MSDMTREEAIKYLKQADITVGTNYKTKTAIALEIGIKALEICHLMSKGIQYITVDGKIYKLTDEKGE